MGVSAADPLHHVSRTSASMAPALSVPSAQLLLPGTSMAAPSAAQSSQTKAAAVNAAVQWDSPVSTAVQTSVVETSPASHVLQPPPVSEPGTEQVRQLIQPTTAHGSSLVAPAAARRAALDTSGHELQAKSSGSHFSLSESLVDAAITELQSTPDRCDWTKP